MNKTIQNIIVTGILTGISAWASVASADESMMEEEENLVMPYGMGIFVGGGIGGFADEDLRALTGTAGFWEARLQIGTRTPIGGEIAYVGGAQSIDALGLTGDALLLTTGFEATARVNLYTGVVQPYAFAGLGWTRYSLTNFDTNTSSVAEDDDVLAIPLGVGMAYRANRFIADLRGTYRVITSEDLVPVVNSRDDSDNLDNWNVALHAGFEF